MHHDTRIRRCKDEKIDAASSCVLAPEWWNCTYQRGQEITSISGAAACASALCPRGNSKDQSLSLAHTALDSALVTPCEAMAPKVLGRLGVLLGGPSREGRLDSAT